MKRFLIIAILILQLALVSVAFGGACSLYCSTCNGTYYVSSAGTDCNSGSTCGDINHPWANDPDNSAHRTNYCNLSAGETVVYRRGDTFWDVNISTNVNGTNGSTITRTSLASYYTGTDPTVLPVLKSAVYLNGTWTNTSGTIYSIALATQPYVVFNGSTELHNGGLSIWAVSDSHHNQTTITTGEWFWVGGTLYVNVGVDPSSGILAQIEASSRSNTIAINTNYSSWVNLELQYSNGTTGGPVYDSGHTGTVIQNVKISRCRADCVRVAGATNPTLTNVTIIGRPDSPWGSNGINETGATTGLQITDPNISGMHGAGVILQGTGATPATIQGTTRSTCVFDNNIGYAVDISSSNGNTVQNCTFTRNGQYRRYGVPSGSYGGYNYGQDGGAIKWEGTSSNNLAQYNLITNLNYCGIGDVISSGSAGGNKAYWNILIGCLVNPLTTFSSSSINPVQFINNIVVHQPHYQQTSLNLTTGYPATTQPEIDAGHLGRNGHAVSFQATTGIGEGISQNNILVIGTLDYPSSGYDTDYTQINTTSLGVSSYQYTISNNLYYDLSGSSTPAGKWNYNNTQYQSFAAYQAALSTDGSITGKDASPGSAYINPLFRSSSDFTPTNKQVCKMGLSSIWSGTDSVTDYNGKVITNGSGALQVPYVPAGAIWCSAGGAGSPYCKLHPYSGSMKWY